MVSIPFTLNGFKVTVLFKGEYYSKQCILYCPTAYNIFT